MSLRVLAISPRFAPTNGADTHRLRLLLPYASAAGWAVEVLAVDAADVPAPTDPWLERNLPADIPVHRVRAWPTRRWGMRGLSQRSVWPLYRKGYSLLETGRFDLVFFSTTEFALHVLGPLWKRKFGVPFCMDYQDPWVNDYYRRHPGVVPPGGRLKFFVADRLHQIIERYVVKSCSGFLLVTESYLNDLVQRYGRAVSGKPWLVRTFPAEPKEFTDEGTGDASEATSQPVWRYVGRGGADMRKTALAFFRAWQRALAENPLLKEVRFEAIGTSYAAAGSGEKTFAPMVAETMLASQVYESPDRLGYSDMLHALKQSNALIVFGSDDPAYTASKIYPYLLSGKPLLAIFHENSSVVKLMNEAGGGLCVTFNDGTSLEELAAAIWTAWFQHSEYSRIVNLDAIAFEQYTAKSQTRDVAVWFARMLAIATEHRMENQ